MSKISELWNLVQNKPVKIKTVEPPNPFDPTIEMLSSLSLGKGSGTLTGASLMVGQGQEKITDTEALIRIERAVNGKLIHIAKHEGARSTTWLVPEGEELMTVLKQAMADLKV